MHFEFGEEENDCDLFYGTILKHKETWKEQLRTKNSLVTDVLRIRLCYFQNAVLSHFD